MTRLLVKLAPIMRAIALACLWFSAFGLFVMTVITGWQVFARYVLNDSPHWSEQLSLLLMIYYILFAAAAGVRDRGHLGLTFIQDLVPTGLKRVMIVVVNLVICAFGCTMVYYGAAMAKSTWSHVIPTLGLSTGVSYLPFPLAGFLIVLFSLEHVINTLAGSEVECSWN